MAYIERLKRKRQLTDSVYKTWGI